MEKAEKVLFVCTSNTARSAMAEFILEKYGGGRFIASSAGLFSSYAPMTERAAAVLIENGISREKISLFRSRRVTEEMIGESDVTVCVTEAHAELLRTDFPQYRDKIRCFEYPVNDLWEDTESYRDCFLSLKKNISEMFSLSGESITVRDMNEDGAEAAARLESVCFSHPWELSEYKKAMENHNFVCLCAYLGEEFAGFLMASYILDEASLLDIATEEKFRRTGVGSALIGELSVRLRSVGVDYLMLEAREKNIPARSLYEKLGFSAVGKRNNYYKDPPDDAVLYTLSLGRGRNV